MFYMCSSAEKQKAGTETCLSRSDITVDAQYSKQVLCNGEASPFTTQVACFTSTKVQILTHRCLVLTTQCSKTYTATWPSAPTIKSPETKSGAKTQVTGATRAFLKPNAVPTASSLNSGTQFISFTGTKVQILTLHNPQLEYAVQHAIFPAKRYGEAPQVSGAQHAQEGGKRLRHRHSQHGLAAHSGQ